MITSAPQAPPQPNSSPYPVNRLETFTEYTFESYLAAAGAPPPFDPNLPIKTWLDTSVDASDPTAPQIYRTFKVIAGQPRMTSYALPASQAASVNLPDPNQPLPHGSVAQTQSNVQVPLRALLPNEVLILGPLGIVEVQRTDLQPVPAAGGWTQQDRDLLHAIAAKVGAA